MALPLLAPNAPLPRSRAAGAARLLCLLAVLYGCGWAVTAGHAKWLLVILGAAALGALAATQRGAFTGLCVLGAMNGVPFFDTSRFATSKLTIADLAAFALIAAAAVWALRARERHRLTPAGVWLSRAGCLLLAWWLLTLVRSAGAGSSSITRAGSFGRDFAFFALLSIVLPRVRLQPREIARLLAVLAAGVCVFALGQTMTATGVGHPGSLIHIHFTLEESGLTRVYADMTDLVTAGLALSLCASLLSRQRKVRLVAVPLALLLATSTVVQLTRARWLGMAAGLVFVLLWLTVRREAQLRATLRRRLALAGGGLGLAGSAVLLAAPGLLSNATISHRLTSVFTTLGGGGGTVAIRESVTKTMLSYLGGKWPAGLGFISPSVHYFYGLPLGSIRDSDLGVLNAVMTMGVVGAALVYLPVLAMLLYLLRRPRPAQELHVPRRPRPAPPLGASEYGWLRVGGVLWIVATLASSLTLVTLFSPSGLVLSAVLLAVLAQPGVQGVSAADGSADAAADPATHD